MTTPFPHQLQGLKRIKKLNYRVLISWTMGLGKSLESLLAAKELDKWPVVIVCPASLKLNWRREASVHMGWQAAILSTRTPPTNFLEIARNHRLYIINYDVLGTVRAKEGRKSGPGWLPFLKSLKPQMVILDECQYAKSHGSGGSKRTKWVRQLCQGVPHVLALSGTPLTNRPSELWPIINILRPDVFNSWPDFGHAHCGPRMTPWGIKYDGAEALDVLHGRLIDTCMIRKRKEEVLKDLPTMARHVVPVELSNPQEYEAAASDLIAWLKKTDPDRARRARKAERLVRMGYLKRLAAKLKLPEVFGWADAFLSGDDGKLVLFGHHTEILEALMERYGKQAVCIRGSVPPNQRQQILDRFNRDPKVRLLVGNIDAAGVGLSVSSASTVALIEFPWTPAQVEQAIARIHGIGRGIKGVRSVAYFLAASGTIDEYLLQLLEQKQKITDAVLDGHAGNGAGFNLYDQLEQRLLEQNR